MSAPNTIPHTIQYQKAPVEYVEVKLTPNQVADIAAGLDSVFGYGKLLDFFVALNKEINQ